MKKHKITKILLLTAGTLALALGCIGIILPILPTTPFFMLTLICYAKGSEKFERWFISTKLYKKYLENFVKTKSMTNGGKVKILVLVTLLILIPIILVDNLHMKILLSAVILGHYLYFIFKVKSISKKELYNMLEKLRENDTNLAKKEN